MSMCFWMFLRISFAFLAEIISLEPSFFCLRLQDADDEKGKGVLPWSVTV